MNKTYRFFIFVFLTLSFLVFSHPAISSQDKWDIKRQSIEGPAPNFVLEDLNGQEAKLSDYKREVVLLIFSTTWCPHCRTTIPYFKKIYQKYKDRGLVIFNIDIMESQKRVSSFATKYKLPYRVLLDKSGEVAKSYGVRGVPTLILINKEGKIVCRQCRSVDVLLKMLLASSG
ncbi:MAG: redoxin domain-containing protein [Proteobacteria bacterium]|nr:redoxin domain-containing protein [Pseudomonadota bacterium]